MFTHLGALGFHLFSPSHFMEARATTTLVICCASVMFSYDEARTVMMSALDIVLDLSLNCFVEASVTNTILIARSFVMLSALDEADITTIFALLCSGSLRFSVLEF